MGLIGLLFFLDFFFFGLLFGCFFGLSWTFFLADWILLSFGICGNFGGI